MRRKNRRTKNGNYVNIIDYSYFGDLFGRNPNTTKNACVRCLKKLFEFMEKKDMKIKNGKHDVITMSGQRVPKSKIISSLIRNNGNVIKVLKDLELADFLKFQKLIDTDPDLQNLQNYFRKKLCYEAEQTIMESLHGQNEKIKLDAAKFILISLDREHYGTRPLINIDQRQMQTPEEQKAQVVEIFGLKDAPGEDESKKEELLKEAEKIKEDCPQINEETIRAAYEEKQRELEEEWAIETDCEVEYNY